MRYLIYRVHVVVPSQKSEQLFYLHLYADFIYFLFVWFLYIRKGALE